MNLAIEIAQLKQDMDFLNERLLEGINRELYDRFGKFAYDRFRYGSLQKRLSEIGQRALFITTARYDDLHKRDYYDENGQRISPRLIENWKAKADEYRDGLISSDTVHKTIELIQAAIERKTARYDKDWPALPSYRTISC